MLVKAHIDVAVETIPRKTKHKKDALWEKAKVISAQEQSQLAQKFSKEIQMKAMSSDWMAIKWICKQHLTKINKTWLAKNNQNRRGHYSKQVKTRVGNFQGNQQSKSSWSIIVVSKTPQDQLQNWEPTSRSCFVNHHCHLMTQPIPSLVNSCPSRWVTSLLLNC